MPERPIDVLIVEDSAADVHLTVTALRDARIPNTIHIVEDGEEALTFLHHEGTYADAPRPDLVLLDLNLPKKDGFEVLAEARENSLHVAVRKLERIVFGHQCSPFCDDGYPGFAV